jgi:hypothetical protein
MVDRDRSWFYLANASARVQPTSGGSGRGLQQNLRVCDRSYGMSCTGYSDDPSTAGTRCAGCSQSLAGARRISSTTSLNRWQTETKNVWFELGGRAVGSGGKWVRRGLSRGARFRSYRLVFLRGLCLPSSGVPVRPAVAQSGARRIDEPAIKVKASRRAIACRHIWLKGGGIRPLEGLSPLVRCCPNRGRRYLNKPAQTAKQKCVPARVGFPIRPTRRHKHRHNQTRRQVQQTTHAQFACAFRRPAQNEFRGRQRAASPLSLVSSKQNVSSRLSKWCSRTGNRDPLSCVIDATGQVGTRVLKQGA